MLVPDAPFLKALEEKIGAIEACTDAEIVLIGRKESGSYRDLDLLWAILAALTMLALVLFSPIPVQPSMVIPEVAAAGAIGFWLSHRFPRVRLLLCERPRMRRQARKEAQAVFVEEAISGTLRRTGILVFYSILEDELVLLPDAGLKARIAAAEWNTIVHEHVRGRGREDERSRLVRVLGRLGKLLAREIPPLPGDNPDELPNAPRGFL